MIYLALIILLFYLSSKYDDQIESGNSISLKFVAGFIILLAALSTGIGGDVTNTYAPEYPLAPTLDNLTIDYIFNSENYFAGSPRYKPLYIITRSIIRTLSDEWWIYHFFHALYINLIILWFIKKRTNYLFLTIFLYFITNYFEYNTEIIRESLSVATGLIAFNFWENRKYIYFVFFAIVAYFFHSSGMIVFLMPVAFLLNKIPSNKIFLTFIILAILLPIIYQRVDLEVIISLLGEEEQSQSSRIIQELNSEVNLNFYIMHYFKFLIFPGLLLALISDSEEEEFKYIGCVYIYFLFRLFQMFGVMFYRFANYFAPFCWLFIAHSAICISRKYVGRDWSYISVSIILLFFYLQNYYLLGTDNSGLGIYIYERYLPYKSIIFENI